VAGQIEGSGLRLDEKGKSGLHKYYHFRKSSGIRGGRSLNYFKEPSDQKRNVLLTARRRKRGGNLKGENGTIPSHKRKGDYLSTGEGMNLFALLAVQDRGGGKKKMGKNRIVRGRGKFTFHSRRRVVP